MSQLGGGGTATTGAVVHASNVLAESPADFKVLLVITDGMANQADTCALAVAAAREQGVRVIGALQDPEQDTAFMDEQFGEGNWYPIAEARQAPAAFLEHLEGDRKQATTHDVMQDTAFTPEGFRRLEGAIAGLSSDEKAALVGLGTAPTWL